MAVPSGKPFPVIGFVATVEIAVTILKLEVVLGGLQAVTHGCASRKLGINKGIETQSSSFETIIKIGHH